MEPTPAATPATPPGWYPDPTVPGQQRYWDGAAWSVHIAPVAPPAAPYPPGYAPPTSTNGYAIASLVLGILWIYWIGSILAIIFGTKARKEIAASQGRQAGGGLATAGIVLGWIGSAMLLIVLVIVAITFLGGEASQKFSSVGTNVN